MTALCHLDPMVGGQVSHPVLCNILTRMETVEKKTKKCSKLSILRVCVCILCVCACEKIVTVCCGIQIHDGRAEITPCPLWYAYTNGGSREKDKEMFKIIHLVSVCVYVVCECMWKDCHSVLWHPNACMYVHGGVCPSAILSPLVA